MFVFSKTLQLEKEGGYMKSEERVRKVESGIHTVTT